MTPEDAETATAAAATASWAWPLLASVAAVVPMAFYAGLETGFYSVNRVRLAVRIARGSRDAIALDRERRRPTGALIAMLLMINIAGFVQAWGGAKALHAHGFGPIATTAIDFAVLLPIVFLLGDLLPKDLFRLHADTWTYRCAWAIRLPRLLFTAAGIVLAIELLARGLTRAFGAPAQAHRPSSREELIRSVREGEGAGLLARRDVETAQRVLALRASRVEDRLVPWSATSTLSLAATPEERSRLLRGMSFTRVPVVGDGGGVVGMLATIDAMLHPADPTDSLMAHPVVLRPETPIGTALRLMRAHRTQSAIVGGVDAPLGIVTIKDLVRPIVGEAAWLGD